ncbi:Nucleolar protein of 40 kDa [Mortierella sp. GBA43]|nr:Nucleolar protein of 40 kDa [Mortierella sp. GBA43]
MESQQAAFERFNRDAAAGKFKGSGNSKRHEGRNADSTSGGDEPRPDLYSIHQGKVVRIEDFGAFIQIPGFRKHGLVHKTQASKHFTEHISDVVAIGDHVWVKVTSLQDDKIALSMKYVSQGNGTDLDPNLIQLTEAEDKRKVHTGFVDKGPISIEDGGILRKTVCKKCGASGHLAVDCFSGGEKFDLLADDDGEAYELDTRSGSSKKEKKSKDRHKDKKDKDNHKDRDKDRHRHRDRDRESTRDRRDRQESSSHRKEKRRDRSRSPKRGAEPRGSKVESLSDALAVMRAHKA